MTALLGYPFNLGPGSEIKATYQACNDVGCSGYSPISPPPYVLIKIPPLVSPYQLQFGNTNSRTIFHLTWASL